MKKNYILICFSFWYSFSLLSQEIQRFNLDTIVEKEIIGKKGTVIYFFKEDLNISPNSKLTLELQENYNGKENKVESLKFSFISSNGKQIMLKKGKKLDLFLPKNNLMYQEYKVFHSKKESETINWFIANHLYESVFYTIGGGISKSMLRHKDTVAKEIKSNKRNYLTREEYYKKHPKITEDTYYFFIPKNLQKVFIPYFIEVNKTVNFYIKKKGNKYFQPRFFIYYENLKMYDIVSKLPDESLNFKNIPIFENTFLIAIKEDFDMDKRTSIYYSEKIKLNQNLNNKLLSLNLKKTSKHNLKKLFE